MAVITNNLSSPRTGNLRPLDPRRDLEAVADLVEFSFSTTLDPDGRRYLQKMRSLAQRNRGLSSFSSTGRLNSMVGFVWEENRRVVANLSLIPFFHQGKRIDLIANVAVYPEYRRRGIARALTSAALEKSRRRLARATWLQVRHDNQAAIGLYSGLGFKSRACRTTWVAAPDALKGDVPPGYSVTPRHTRFWPQQGIWLDRNYPPSLRWHFPLKVAAMRPGPWSLVYRFFNEVDLHHWAVNYGGQLQGVLSWQKAHGYADLLWLAAPAQYEERVLQAVVPFIRRECGLRRPVSLDYEAGRAEDTLQQVGFKSKTTLIWMEVKHGRYHQG